MEINTYTFTHTHFSSFIQLHYIRILQSDEMQGVHCFCKHNQQQQHYCVQMHAVVRCVVAPKTSIIWLMPHYVNGTTYFDTVCKIHRCCYVQYALIHIIKENKSVFLPLLTCVHAVYLLFTGKQSFLLQVLCSCIAVTCVKLSRKCLLEVSMIQLPCCVFTYELWHTYSQL